MARRGVRTAWWVSVIAAGALVVVNALTRGPSSEPPSPSMDHTVRVWHWNIAGNTMHRGSVSDGIVDAVADSVITRRADVVSLNEVCESQYTAIRDRLAERGWPQAPDNFARFAPELRSSPNLCGGRGGYGVALFGRHGLGAARRYRLSGGHGTEPRVMLCAPRTDLPHLTYCTTHIATTTVSSGGSVVARRQLARVRSLLDGLARRGQTYVVAGDFNAQPHYARLDTFYAASADTRHNPGNIGAHRELDDADKAHCPGYGEATTLGGNAPAAPCGGHAKVDLVLVRQSQLAGGYSADALKPATSCRGLPTCSDHRVLVGTVRLRVAR
ncbi:endonuclease/exonuclease/phosphatase family protein [Streptomyces beihaiensis]|uniref:Endonuclease/exonuclease/phosphatase family protein n=1 Tax=Streptomyces beihaiensis TaxID=2984495 RepID=A0ABT3U2Z2_9ACTN|nr:endonuclease/exonuclease/phosphatase family protein [Streptomyces beihaiensis]MCX3062578.1 endonuclease/exonuclease/phosphatase family protein [Streptomyces beihaiensis]